MSSRPIAVALACLLAFSCDESEVEAPAFELLTDREQLIRLSVDLRGIHPTEAEIRQLEDGEKDYRLFVEDYIEDPRFLDRMLEVFNLRYLTRTDDTYFDLSEVGLGGIDDTLMGQVIADEPLELLRYVIDNDLPYSTMVTAPHTMANPLLAQMWDIAYPEGSTGWQPATYNDGRPHAGFLTMTTIWQRYPSMGGNANRHRANAVSKIALCDDYLSRPIVLNRAAVDQLTEDPENAIAMNDGCQSCHATLDPLSANFFGFFNYDDDLGIDQIIYRQENEEEWLYYAGKEPGYFGRPTANLVELGEQVAEDPRFADCAVQTVFEGITQRTVEPGDWSEIQGHTDLFLEDDMNIKTLVRSIVNSTSYRAASANDPELNDRLAGIKKASPAQLASIIEDLTGYRWTFGGDDGLTTHTIGLPVLAGGVDGDFVTLPTHTPSLATMFVQERLAQSAGWHVAAHDLDLEREGPARLLAYVTADDSPESNPEAFEQQVRYLYLTITGIPLPDDATEPAALAQLWKYLYSVEASPTSAWAGVVSTVLRDPRVLMY